MCTRPVTAALSHPAYPAHRVIAFHSAVSPTARRPVPQAIAVNLREMFGFRVPIISVVIGEGGSGGALAIGVSNKNLIMEHAVYYVASPEACAAILWKSRDKAATVCCSPGNNSPHQDKGGQPFATSNIS